MVWELMAGGGQHSGGWLRWLRLIVVWAVVCWHSSAVHAELH